ncbi:MAG: restriction endonuclease [Oscillatoria princeps RMCB-10]|jgi:restriction endonuclease Mrr|nr:restriction endonuclease [Oscillatoria princeps RMCB-10]
MNGQVHQFPPDSLNLLVDTIPSLCKSKKDVLLFFSSAGVNQKHLADITNRVHKDPNSINKYEIAREILVRLNDAGDAALRERREIVKRVVEFYDFSRCWPDQQIKAKGLVAQVREFVNVKDAVTRLQQEYESKLDEERVKRQQEENERLELLSQKRQKRQRIRDELLALYKETDAKKRGKQLEGILNRLFELEGILVREAFTITGENKEGVIQQIDGAIEVKSHLYLVEMKWCKEALGPSEVAQHMVRIFQRHDVRGIFISASGYTEAAILDIQKALNQKIIVLFTLKELVLLLERENYFESLLNSKVEAIQLEGKLLYDL